MSEQSRISMTRAVSASPERAFQVVFEVEKFPDFMPNVLSVTVLSAQRSQKVVEWEMVIDDAPLSWTEEINYDRAGFQTSFRSLEGAFSRFDGSWKVHPQATGSVIEVLIEYDLGVPEIQDIIGPMLKERLTQNLEGMLRNIESYVETP